MMTHTYQIDGIHCGSCVAKIRSELLKIGDITEAEVRLESQQATLTMQRHIPIEKLQQAIAKAGAFTIRDQDLMMEHAAAAETKKNWFVTYKPLLIVFAFIIGIAAVAAFQHGRFDTMQWMHNFMAGFFITFSFFKFLDLRGFADSYRSYDLLAKKVYAYGFIYPFIELGLGIAYISGWQIVFTNIATIIVMGFSSIGVIQSVVNKRKIRCACLGAVFNLPMSTVTIIEDLLMVVMSGMMLAGII
jgi:copper chaperone CopZ